MVMTLQPLAREAILRPGFWKFSRPVPVLVRPVVERTAREPGLPESELPVLWAALDAIAASASSLDRNEWRDLVFAIHWATGGSDEGLEAAAAWSEKAPGWDESSRGLLEVMWGHADEGRVGGITAATVFKRAAAGGWLNPATVGVPDTDGFELEGAAALQHESKAVETVSDGAQSVAGRPEIGPPARFSGPVAGVGAVMALTAPAGPPDSWEQPAYSRDRKGVVLPTVENVVRAFSDEWELGWQVAHDAFRDELLVAPAGTTGQWRPITDADLVRFRIVLEQKGFKSAPKELARDGVVLVAERRRFDSAIYWLDEVAQCWDGVRRVDSFMRDAFGAEDTPYARAVSRYMWTALAGRVLDPGIKADMAIILEGGQGARKTSALEALVPDPQFFTEVDLSKSDDDLARLLRGTLVVEISELRGLKTKDKESIKAWVSRKTEKWVPKFKEFGTSFPRRCLLFGTTNQTEILADETGNRRWLPLHVTRADVGYIEQWREQLWAEGAAMFRGQVADRLGAVGGAAGGVVAGGGVLWQEAESLAPSEHDGYRQTDDWEDAVAEWLAGSDALDGAEGGLAGRARGESLFTVADVLCGALGMSVKELDMRTQTRAGAVLRALGYVKRDVREGNRVGKKWAKA